MAWVVAALTEAGPGGKASAPPGGVPATGTIEGGCGMMGVGVGPVMVPMPCLLVMAVAGYTNQINVVGIKWELYKHGKVQIETAWECF